MQKSPEQMQKEIREAREAWDAEHEDTQAAFHRTDLGNGERLIQNHGADLRYCYPWGRWLIWDGQRWAVDDGGKVVALAKDTTRRIYKEAADADVDTERTQLANHAAKSESDARLQAMVSLAKSEPGIPVSPDELDADPWLLNCASGTIDLRTGQLHRHRRGDLLTKVSGGNLDPNASCPRFLAFLECIFDGNEDLTAFVQRAIGYSLTGITSERCLFICYGGGANGKSTLLETIRYVAGDYAVTTPAETLMIKRCGGVPNDVARLKGARFVTVSETYENARLSEAVVKSLTGGDTLTARFMRAEFFDFKPECALWLCTNHKPVIRGTDRAIWDRIRLIPFEVSIPDEKQDKQLLAKLQDERDGILGWAVQGCVQWATDGLGRAIAVDKAVESYRNEMDTLGTFLQDTGIIAYSTYGAWCDENGEHAISHRRFASQVRERGYAPVKDNQGKRVWRVPF